MKIRIFFAGKSINYIEYCDNKPVKLVAFVDYLGDFYYFSDFKGYSRDYNKTVI